MGTLKTSVVFGSKFKIRLKQLAVKGGKDVTASKCGRQNCKERRGKRWILVKDNQEIKQYYLIRTSQVVCYAQANNLNEKSL